MKNEKCNLWIVISRFFMYEMCGWIIRQVVSFADWAALLVSNRNSFYKRGRRWNNFGNHIPSKNTHIHNTLINCILQHKDKSSHQRSQIFEYIWMESEPLLWQKWLYLYGIISQHCLRGAGYGAFSPLSYPGFSLQEIRETLDIRTADNTTD